MAAMSNAMVNAGVTGGGAMSVSRSSVAAPMLSCIRLQQRLAQVGIAKAFLPVAKADDLKADVCEAIHAQRHFGACGQVDDPSRNKRPPVVNTNLNATARALIANNYAGAEGQALMSRRNAHVIIMFAVRRA
jgi:hypothetical protein